MREHRRLIARRPPFRAGQYTDDSQLARELVASVVERGGFVAADYAARIEAIFTEQRIVGRGRATDNAAARLCAGVAWQQAGESAPAAGNGSAMRAAPVGLLFGGDPALLVHVAVDQGRITHQDPRCAAGAVAIAAAAAYAQPDAQFDVERFAAEIVQLVEPLDGALADGVADLPALIGVTPEAAFSVISVAGERDAVGEEWDRISPFVTPSVLWSLYAFARTPDDFWQTICTAIAVGGDVDTTAAMAGAISGARLGLAAIPEQPAEKVHD